MTSLRVTINAGKPRSCGREDSQLSPSPYERLRLLTAKISFVALFPCARSPFTQRTPRYFLALRAFMPNPRAHERPGAEGHPAPVQ